MKKIILTLGVIVCSNTFAAPQQSNIWQDFKGNSHTQLREKLSKESIIKRSLILDETQFKKLLLNKKTAPDSNLKQANKQVNKQVKSIEIDLPLPDGSFVRVQAIESSMLSAEMEERYPDIKTWRVVGIDNPAITGRIDFTSNGFHGMLTLASGDTIYIDPDKSHSGNVYNSLSKLNNESHFQTDFNCQVHHDHAIHGFSFRKKASKSLASLPAQDLKTYRLAIAGTAEYTSHLGGQASALATTITTINRINQLYQKEIGIKLQLVTGAELLYTDASTDPYSNNDADALLDENMANMDANVGVANFDLGHVFSRSTIGGLAYVGVACIDDASTPSGSVSAIKAGGATGLPNPQGETFSLEYVAHEIGHQLGATHTFNSTQEGCGGGNRTADTAVEPGSGSTIMSYSGLCGSDDLQFSADSNFHFASISQINDYTRNGDGSACGNYSSTGNQNPEANAGPDLKIPAKTPFILDGSATGGSTYTWDQIDTGAASAVDVDTGDNAIIRSFPPNSNKDRFVPSLSHLFAGTNSKGEKLPQTSRDIEFAFVVRDGSGGIGTDFKTLNVTNTHSIFSVASPSSSTTLSTGQSIGIIWNPAGTNVAPINCQNVDIQLLRESGERNMILASSSNDGNEQITIPGATPSMTDARFMVACSDNSFFNISPGSITIQQSAGDTTAPVISITGTNPISIPQGSNYTDAGVTAVDDIDGTVTVSASGTVNTEVVGTYTITYTASDSSGNTSTKTRNISVTAVVVTPQADTVSPVISLIGNNPVSLIQNTDYNDAGATALDNIDGTINVSITGDVDTSKVGSYTVNYTATDNAGNSATTTRTVIVTAAPANPIVDTTAPVITLVGNITITLEIGQSYTDPGFTAFDNIDGNVNVVVSGEIDTTTAGEYVLNYSATDKAGNITIKNRTIVVTEIKGNDLGTTDNNQKSDSGGGSFGILLLPMGLLVGLRRNNKLIKRA